MDEFTRLGEQLSSPLDSPDDAVRARARATLTTAIATAERPRRRRRPSMLVAAATGIGVVALVLAVLLLVRNAGRPNGGLSPVTGPPDVDILDATPYAGPLPERLEREFDRLEADEHRVDRSSLRGNWRLNGGEATVAAFTVKIRNLRNAPSLNIIDYWVFVVSDDDTLGIDGLVGFIADRSLNAESDCGGDREILRICGGVGNSYVFRTPRDATRVIEINSDGSRRDVSIGHGLAVAWNPGRTYPPEAIEVRGSAGEASGWYRPLNGRWSQGAYERTPGGAELLERFGVLQRERNDEDDIDSTESRESLTARNPHLNIATTRLVRKIDTPSTRIAGRQATTFRYLLGRGTAPGNICIVRTEVGLLDDQRECFALGDAVAGEAYYVAQGIDGYGGVDVVTGLVPDGVATVTVDGIRVPVIGNLYVHQLSASATTVVFKDRGNRREVTIDRKRAPVR